MKKWLKCCFPSSKEEANVKDKASIEYKDENPHQDSPTQSKGNNDSSVNNNSVKDKADPVQVKSAAPKKPTNSSVNKNSTNSQQNNQAKKKPDPVVEYINSSRVITQDEINQAPLVVLDEDKNGNLFKGQQIKINAGGLIGGRNAKDGVAIFSIGGAEGSGNFKADFELNYNENSDYPYIFVIYFERELKTYFIRAYSCEQKILFIKLSGDYTLPLKQKEIISAGNIIFQVTPTENGCLEIANLSRKDLNPNPRQTFDPTKVKEVTIGRGEKCNFSFPKDKSFSRCQTTFTYDEKDKNWVIIDGCKTKSSTNGTWVFGTHCFPIKDEMVVEILTTKVKFSLIQNDK